MRSNPIPLVVCLLLQAACSREAESASSGGGRLERSADTQRTIDQKGAVSSPLPSDRVKTDSVDEREAKVTQTALMPLTQPQLRGEVALREVREGVNVSLHVRNAAPGARRVALDGEGCEEHARRRESASNTVPKQTGLGTLLVDESGHGALDMTLRDADLQPESSNSLRGKALLVYEMLPPARRGARTEVAVACAEIAR